MNSKPIGSAVGRITAAQRRPRPNLWNLGICYGVVRPLKKAALSLHPLLDQALLHSHDYPILLIKA